MTDEDVYDQMNDRDGVIALNWQELSHSIQLTCMGQDTEIQELSHNQHSSDTNWVKALKLQKN